ncbi:MAG: hypothetical protein JRF33_00395 [Deltaproteobacteria bacterium]|nr:hypothetical protein [Deltaproteobacteria bacterium]
MMQLVQIASSASATIPVNDPWTAVGLACLISLGLLAAALMAMAINRSLTRGWIRFSRKQQIRQEEGLWGVEEQSGSAEF